MKTNIEPGCLALIVPTSHFRIDKGIIGNTVTVIKQFTFSSDNFVTWEGDQQPVGCSCTGWLIEGLKHPTHKGRIVAQECNLMRLDDPDFTEDEEHKDATLSTES